MTKIKNQIASNIPVIYDWSVGKYIKLVENTKNPTLREYENEELDYISSIPGLSRKTVIDVGAGYGRILSHIAPPITRNVIAVEINDNMFLELQERATRYPNTTAIRGNANDLSGLLDGQEVQTPVVLSLQNSLGTWEGDSQEALSEMQKVAEKAKGEVIISVFRQEALENQGVNIYRSAKALVGEIDWEKTDFENGIFRSKTGYLSKWRTAQERNKIKKSLDGQIVNEITTPSFWILHVAYN
ncbi:MAG: class I SAM-dependent methyltransferase [Patescibacteria group bacterium]|nr:class I SAM-dependent methyltransferase [Patescibacteria group bacterium]